MSAEVLPGLEPVKEAPERIIQRAVEEGAPEDKWVAKVVARFCLVSGGNDSTVLAHRLQGQYDALLHVDTGTALPGVRDHVERLARELRQPLVVYEAGAAYRTMVLGNPESDLKSERLPWGLPGPGFHKLPYARLKDRQFEAAVRDQKARHGLTGRPGWIMLMSGVRTGESDRRMVSALGREINRRGSQLWVNPLIHWSDRDMREYRDEHKLPQSDVAALIHRSGECNCGAFAAPGEREMLQSMWPAWFGETIERLEEQAAEQGLPCRWGERPGDWWRPRAAVGGPACVGCQQLTLEGA